MSHKSLFLAFTLIFLSGLSLFAQKLKPKDLGIKSKKALNYYLDGREQERYRARKEAIEAFAQAIEIEPGFSNAHFFKGVNHLILFEFEEARHHLLAADSLNPGAFGGIDFHLGQAQFFTGNYAEAVPHYEAYLEEGRGGPTFVKTATVHLRKAIFAREAIKNPVDFQPVNLGSNINSKEDDNMPCLTADDQTLLFVSRRSNSTGGYSRMLRGYAEDFYISKKVDGEWQAAENVGPPLNTERNEGGPCLTQDGRTLYFTVCNKEDGLGNCDLYRSFWVKGNWTEPENLGPKVNSEAWDSQPCLSQDGKRLYFASNRRGGMGNSDIWYCELRNGEWSAAQNLGEPINTSGDEDAPFLHADGVSLYFASDYHNGFGNADLFVSYSYDDGKWSDPKNLGYPINTVAEEGYIFVNAKGTRGYINSSREGGLGKNDLFEFVLDEDIRPKQATFLRGLTRDSITRAPVQALIHLVDVERNDTVRTLYSGRGDGKFLMSLPLEREYAAFVEAPRYLFASKNFYLKSVGEDIYFDLTIDLTPVKAGKQVRLDNIFFEFDSYELKPESEPELRFLHTFLERNPRIRIEIQGHTDNVGSDEVNMTLSQNRAEAVRRYLLEKGIDADRVQARGYGESMPEVPNDTAENRKRNRRTEFKILEVE